VGEFRAAELLHPFAAQDLGAARSEIGDAAALGLPGGRRILQIAERAADLLEVIAVVDAQPQPP